MMEFGPSDPIWRILEAIDAEPTGEFRSLVEAAKLDPKTDFRNACLAGVLLKDADISGFDFSGSDLRGTSLRHAKRSDGVIISSETTLDPVDEKWWNGRNRKEAAWRRLMDRASELIHRGDELGDSASLDEAIALCNEAMTLVPRLRFPLEWAKTQHKLGDALATLGEWESGTERLEEAVVAYREVLQEFTRARGPLDWAGTQHYLGDALRPPSASGRAGRPG